MLRKLYRAIPLSDEFRSWIKSKVPLRWQRQPQFRNFGVINELYFWRLDREIDTVAPIQNYFSCLFPELDTATEGWVWLYDRHGNEITQLQFTLAHAGTHLIRLSEIADRSYQYGTLMWHIRMPDSVANHPAVQENLVYFTDRGYLCYEKFPNQPSFIHGVDRYAVFQRQDTKRYELFYPKLDRPRSWLAEFPLHHEMQEELEIILINRSSSVHDFNVSIHQNGGLKVHDSKLTVEPRGVGLNLLDSNVISKLNKVDGYFLVDGLATHWGRPAIMRHFSCGAMSVMHC